MGRKVFITSDMSIDERLIEVAEQNSNAAILWPWFLTAFDDWGRAEASPKRLKAKIFPLFPSVTIELIEESLRLFSEAGIVRVYTVGGKTYMAIDHDKWFKYQTHIRRSKRDNDESRIPAPPIEDSRECAQIREDERKCEPSPSPTPSPSIDHDDDDNVRTRPNFVTTYEQEFGRLISPTELQDLQSFIDDGMAEEVVCEAIKRTRQQGVFKFSYVKKILNDWYKNHVRDMAGVARVDLEFEQIKAKGQPKGGQAREPTRKNTSDWDEDKFYTTSIET